MGRRTVPGGFGSLNLWNRLDLLRDPGEQTTLVSAAPLPAPDPAGEPTGSAEDGWVLLEGLRRRLDDQAALGRKTQQQVAQLTDSIAALVEVQRRRQRGINLNSFVAYLVFTILCGAGFYFVYQSRANELLEARDHAFEERDAAKKRADDAAAKAAARELADTRAWEVFELLEAGKRAEASAKLAALRDQPLSRTERAILAARAHEVRVMEVDAALKAATASFKAGRYHEVIAPLEAALVGEPTGARAAAMRYFLGIAYAKDNQLDKAVTYLEAAVAADVEHDDARFQLASALDRAGHYGKAREHYDRFATEFPQSQFTGFATRRSATLARHTNPPPLDGAAKVLVTSDPTKPLPPAMQQPPVKQPVTPPALKQPEVKPPEPKQPEVKQPAPPPAKPPAPAVGPSAPAASEPVDSDATP